ncbi:MAG: hypothetical protein KC501_00260, partial [Myxococcales bacterium]|nr:hypothetical protein [Myxococcales bacterium]
MAHRSTPILALALLTSGCVQITTKQNLDHCTYNEGDRYCAEQFPDRPFCNDGRDECAIGDKYGCVAEVRPECHEPCGVLDDEACLGESSSSSGSGSGSDSGSDSGSGSGSSTGPMPCMGNEDCMDAGAPFCEPASGECVGCDGLDDGDGACAELDANAPLCVGATCVACTAEDTSVCDAQALVCDEESNTCVPCTEHDQCGEAACNLFEGTCLPADAVTRVGPGQEYTTLSAAVMSFPAGSEGTIIVFTGMPDYNEAVTVDGGRTLALLANDGDLPRWVLTGGGSPQLTVGDATVLMDGIQVSGNAATGDPGVLVDGG